MSVVAWIAAYILAFMAGSRIVDHKNSWVHLTSGVLLFGLAVGTAYWARGM